MDFASERHWERIRDAAEKVVDRILAALPPELRCRAEEIPVAYDTEPSEDILAEGYEPDLLGLFVGRDHADLDGDPLPPEIVLFLENIWDYANGHMTKFRVEVRRTYLHELGHYLGLNEEDLGLRDLD